MAENLAIDHAAGAILASPDLVGLDWLDQATALFRAAESAAAAAVSSAPEQLRGSAFTATSVIRAAETIRAMNTLARVFAYGLRAGEPSAEVAAKELLAGLSRDFRAPRT